MIQEIWGNYGVCYLQDCREGLKRLIHEQHSRFDLTLSDPPYNNGTHRNSGINDSDKPREVELYENNMPKLEYYQLLTEWFELNKQLSKYIIFTCGKRNLGFWQNYDPIFEDQWGIWRFKNSPNRGTFSKFLKFEPILYWGNFKQEEHKWDGDIITSMIYNGFMAKNEFKPTSDNLIDPDPSYILKHPHSKPFGLYRDIITFYQPKLLLDTFLGSGMTARIAEMYHIQWIGFETNINCISDIRWNIEVGKANPRKFIKNIKSKKKESKIYNSQQLNYMLK